MYLLRREAGNSANTFVDDSERGKHLPRPAIGQRLQLRPIPPRPGSYIIIFPFRVMEPGTRWRSPVPFLLSFRAHLLHCTGDRHPEEVPWMSFGSCQCQFFFFV
jgi:hypothetical protein